MYVPNIRKLSARKCACIFSMTSCIINLIKITTSFNAFQNCVLNGFYTLFKISEIYFHQWYINHGSWRRLRANVVRGNVTLNTRSGCVVVTALVTDFERWQFDVFFAQRTNLTKSPWKESVQRKERMKVCLRG